MSIENIQIIETVSLDFYNNNIKTINVKQLDTDARGVKINCTEHGKKFKLDALSHSAFVRYKKPDGYDVFNDCYIQDDGSIIFSLTQQMTVVTGKSMLDILIFCSSGLTVGDIEDVTNFNDLGIATLSTMTLGLNIHPNATNLENVESTYELNALVDGLARHVAIERHMEELDNTLNTNENQRQTDETARQNAESQRVTAETDRVNAEKLREENVQNTINDCVQKTDDNITNYTNQMDKIIANCSSATDSANDAAASANASADNADIATSAAQQATSDAQAKIDEMQILIEDINQTIGGVIRDDISSASTTYSSEKINTIVNDILVSDTKDNVTTFESADTLGTEETPLEWTEVEVLASGEKHSLIYAKISKMLKNIRYLYKCVTELRKNYEYQNVDSTGYLKYIKDKNKVTVLGTVAVNAKTGEIELPFKAKIQTFCPTTAFFNSDVSNIAGYGVATMSEGSNVLYLYFNTTVTFATVNFSYIIEE